ncbi:hypothetical protein [Companilactobacillus furfuricola]|uniref:hypothetical protein n=1 Tax=Companilactobacillus furfuricola TaxID=1462575 RepID=UPI000F7A845D|nr:hypothetical protein [Companilactobacillus furfuricola]
MKKKRTGLSIIIGGLVIIVLLAAYTSYKSYTNIGVGGDDPKVETTNTKSNKSQKSPKKDRKGPNKKDSNIFLQDAQHPDRILAINPNGTNGVYLYRMQSDGTIYPEYQYFNGQTKISKNSIHSISSGAKKNGEFNLKKTDTSNGEYQDADSGKVYNALNYPTLNQKFDNMLSKTNNPIYLSVKKKANESNFDYLLRVTKYKSDPSSSDGQKNSGLFFQHSYQRLKNGNYYDTKSKMIYGNQPNDISLSQFYKNPSKYIDNSFDITKDVMYYKQNDQTEVSNDSINENTQWTSNYNGNNYQQRLFPKFAEEQSKREELVPPNKASSNLKQIWSTNTMAQFVDNGVQ